MYIYQNKKDVKIIKILSDYPFHTGCEGSSYGVHHSGQAQDGAEAVQLTTTDVLRGGH
jgi:hypothetical protein